MAATDAGESSGDEAKAAFHLALRARGVRDLAVLRAAERVPRQHFVEVRHAGLVARDLAVPIAGGQSASPAWVVAAMVESLAVEPGHRVLEVGAGSGYGTAILARLGADVLAVERVRSLAAGAASRLDALGIGGARVLWADGCDGCDGGPDGERYDRILVHAGCDAVPAALLARLAPGGRLVCARPDASGQRIAAIADGGEDQGIGRALAGRLPPLRRGLLDL